MEKYIYKFNLNDLLPENIIKKFALKHFKKGEYILITNYQAEGIYFLVDGEIEISYNLYNGTQLYLNILTPLSIFGDIEFIHNSKILFDVVSKTDTFVLYISNEYLRKNLKDNSKFWRFLAIESTKKLLSTNKIIFSKSTLKAKDLLLNYLNENNNKIFFKTLDELSKTLNISYRNLTRTIRQLQNENLIKKEKNIIILK